MSFLSQLAVSHVRSWRLCRRRVPAQFFDITARTVGFMKEPRLEFFHVYRKTTQRSQPHLMAVQAFDTCRYSLGVALAG